MELEYSINEKGTIIASRKAVEVIGFEYGHTQVKPMHWLLDKWILKDSNALLEFGKTHDISKVKYYKIVEIGDVFVTAEEWSAESLPDVGPGFPEWDGKYTLGAPTGNTKRFKVCGVFYPIGGSYFMPFLKSGQGISYPQEIADVGYWCYHPRRKVMLSRAGN